jgi:hypothetical protein
MKKAGAIYEEEEGSPVYLNYFNIKDLKFNIFIRNLSYLSYP